ncbi:hypothetical protein MTO96_031479 [Rhipicephalus appendiculatus]
MHSCGFPQEGPDAGPGSAAPLFTAASLAQSRCSAVPASGPQTDRLSLQSQSFSQGYGSVLPTSLTYIGLSTRGCSPWRPAADVGTVRHENPTQTAGDDKLAQRVLRSVSGGRHRSGLPTNGRSPWGLDGVTNFSCTARHNSREPSPKGRAVCHGTPIADPAAYFSQRKEPGAPYSRGTPSPPGQCQGPLSAPAPRTSLLEAEGRSQQGPGRKCVQQSGRPSPSSVRASSFGESLRHLPKAPCHRRDIADRALPRTCASKISRLQEPTGSLGSSPKSAEAFAAEGGTVCTDRQRTRRIASSMTDRRRFSPFLSYLAAPRKCRVSFLRARTVGRALGRRFRNERLRLRPT